MRKGTLLLSAALTTFMLVILVGAASAYQKIQKTNLVSNQQAAVAPAPVTETTSQDMAAEAPAPVLTPEQAAGLAAQVLGRTDLYSVETADFNGASAYKVTFSSGDLVFVSPQGQILSVTKIVPTVVSLPPAQNVHRSKDKGSNTVTSQPSGGEDDHEDHEGDD